MKGKKKLIATAKIMFKASLRDGLLDQSKIRQVIKKLASQKVVGHSVILRYYKRLVRQALAKEEVTVETPTQLSNPKKLEAELLSKTSAKRVKFKKTPNIVFGAKITHGDWVYDATLGAKLKQLSKVA
jgi:F-type H+-transporting ATPase subunit delta